MIGLVLTYLWLWLKLRKHSLALPKQNTGIINSRGIRLGGKKLITLIFKLFLCHFPFAKYSPVLLPTPSPHQLSANTYTFNSFKKSTSKTLSIPSFQVPGEVEWEMYFIPRLINPNRVSQRVSGSCMIRLKIQVGNREMKKLPRSSVISLFHFSW